MRRRLTSLPTGVVAALVLAGLPVAAVGVLAVEVALARVAPRLDDEVGHRPVRAVVSAGDDPLHVVWLGDSTATGVGTSDVEDSMAWRVAAGLGSSATPRRGVLLTVLAVSGAQVHEVLDEQLDALAELVPRGATSETPAPDVTVFVSIGANDVTALTRLATFTERYRRLVDRVHAAVPDAGIVLVGVPDMGTAPRIPVPLRQIAGARASQFDDVIDDVARSTLANDHVPADRVPGGRVHHVDLAARTGSIFASDPDRYFSADRFHPSPDGHGIWADAVLASLGT